jgi:cellulose synthase/poly-beta-1,6-N-acetylglucosamine synthase-like glycosyltransferase
MQAELILLIITTAVLTYQYGYMLIFFTAFPMWKKRREEEVPVSLSLVVCAKNELENLKKHLPLWLEQDHPDYEVVVVNDRSWDESDEYLDQMAEKHPHLKVRHLRDYDRHWIGKKFALTIGIKAAKNERLVLSDADCRPSSKHWLTEMGRKAKRSTLLLGYGAYAGKGFTASFSRFETQMAALHWMSWANRGRAYMGVGRNLSYTRSLFMENNGFSKHMHIPSGDDDLFVSEVAKGQKTKVVLNPDAFTLSAAPMNGKEWLKQKRRHLSTSNFYPWPIKWALGAWGATSILAYMLLIFSPWLWNIHPSWVLVLLGRWLVLLLFYTVAALRLKNAWSGFLILLFEAPLLLSQLYLHRINRSKGIEKKW